MLQNRGLYLDHCHDVATDIRKHSQSHAQNLHWQLLYRQGFARFGIVEALAIWLMTTPVTYQNENITISTKLDDKISTWSCNRSPIYHTLCCKVCESLFILTR